MSKVWLITGAGSGIGTGIAKAALQAGDRVVATGRNVEKVRQALVDVASDKLAILKLDVTDEAEVQRVVEAAAKQFGQLDVVVNNAGYSLLGNFEELTSADIEALFATNFYGASYVMRAALPVLRQQRSGHIINISSSAGAAAYKHCSAYSASKFALEGLSLCVGIEVEPFGIKVTVVEPGFFRTDLLAPQNAKWSGQSIEDYAAEGKAEDMWSPFNGAQTGDPAKLGQALVTLTGLDNPPKVFIAGSDALAGIRSFLEARLEESQAHEALSQSTDGSF